MYCRRHDIAGVALVALLVGCIAAPGGAARAAAARETVAMLTLAEQDNGRRLTAHVGDQIEIRLAENATTGYRWAPDDNDAKLLQFVEATANYPHAAIGSGGEAIFRFRVVGAGSGTLALKYWRHWEGAGSIIKRFAVTIESVP